MTVSTETSFNIFSGNGVTTVFSTNIYGISENDFIVKKRDSSGVETTLTLSSDYTISDLNDSTGITVSYPISGSALPYGEKLVITRVVDYTQELDLTPVAAFLPETIETELDRHVMMIQQIKDDNDRTLKVALGYSNNLIAPTPTPNSFLGFDNNGDLFTGDPTLYGTPVSSLSPLPISLGGTNAADAPTARDNLGLKGGATTEFLEDVSAVQAWDPDSYPATNTIIRTRAEGFAYEVAASGASDHHVTTAGGVKLYVLDNSSADVNVKAFAQAADSDDTEALHRAIANSSSGDIYLPDGTFTATHLLIDNNVRINGNGRKRTFLTLTGHTTHGGYKGAIAAVGNADLSSQMQLNGLDVNVQSATAGVCGLLVTRKLNMNEVYFHDAPQDGIRMFTVDPNDEAPYFCQFRNVWAKDNGRNGLHITENCNANRFEVCQFDRNAEHGVHQVLLGLPGVNQAVYNNIFMGGQASYNEKHGFYFQNGSECFIYGSYAEYNSQTDGGNPKTGAYKNLQLGSTFAKGFFQMGSLGTSTDPEDTLGLNTVANNSVYVSGRLVTPFSEVSLGYPNVGSGRTIKLQGAGGCEHNIEFYEGVSIIARLRYNGAPGTPSNEIRMEVTNDNGSTWKTLWHGKNNGFLSFYGETPVAQGTTAADATDLASAIDLANNLKAIIRNVGLAT